MRHYWNLHLPGAFLVTQIVTLIEELMLLCSLSWSVMTGCMKELEVNEHVGADKSAMGAINRPLQRIHDSAGKFCKHVRTSLHSAKEGPSIMRKTCIFG